MTALSSPEQRFRDIEENYKEIEENIERAAVRSGRSRGDIRFMAVTKTVEPIFINHALSLGIDLIGENKVQELLSKLEYLPPQTEKHLIGHLQSNKVRKVADVVSCIQSVDSLSVAAEISRQMQQREKTMDVLLEVNIGAEASKTGFDAAALPEAGAQIAGLPGIRVRGVMAVPPICESESLVRGYFEKTRRLYEDLKAGLSGEETVDTLSIGMSSDYVPAILEGATLVRVGSALFGPRRY